MTKTRNRTGGPTLKKLAVVKMNDPKLRGYRTTRALRREASRKKPKVVAQIEIIE